MRLIVRATTLFTVAASAVVLFSCSPRAAGNDGQGLREGLPVDTVNAGLETVLSWRHRAVLHADLNGDGRTEQLVVAADVSLAPNDEPLWEDGHRWGVYVEDSTQRTLLYSRFLPHGVAEVAVGVTDADGTRDVLILERTPQHSRAIVLEYQRPGSARPVSDANYPLQQWLPSLTSIRPQRERVAAPVPERFAAPWSRDTLRPGQVPAEYMRAWRAAENRSSCALVAPATVRVQSARPRIAQFAGGWAVAYDTPEQRSAFGVAGTGTTPDAATFDAWPHRRRWADGSSAGWGPEGGAGPNQLAYLRIAGQECLYNVWSRLGQEHLQQLLLELRFVEI